MSGLNWTAIALGMGKSFGEDNSNPERAVHGVKGYHDLLAIFAPDSDEARINSEVTALGIEILTSTRSLRGSKYIFTMIVRTTDLQAIRKIVGVG